MFGATPSERLMSAKWREPSSTSRMTSRLQRSPTTSSARAIEQFWASYGRWGTGRWLQIATDLSYGARMAHLQNATGSDRRWRVLTVVSVATFMASLDLFIVNIAFPDISRAFEGTSVAAMSWVLNAYAIVFAALLVPAGRMADRIGRKRAFVGGIVVFVIGSALCGIANSVGLLIGARVIQAAGGAVLLPTSLALLLPEFAPAERPKAISIWAAVGAVAAAAGPPIGGLLVEASWRLVFLVNVPVGLAAVYFSLRVLRESSDPDHTRPDLLGTVLFAASIGLLALGLVKAPDWGWGSAATLGAIAASGVGLGAFWMRCRTHPSPVVEPEMLRVRSFALAGVASLLFSTAFAAMLLAGVLFMTGVWGFSVLKAGPLPGAGPGDGGDVRDDHGPAAAADRAGHARGHRHGRVRVRRRRLAVARRGRTGLRERDAARPAADRRRRRAHAADARGRGDRLAAARAVRDGLGGLHDVAPARVRARRGDPGRGAGQRRRGRRPRRAVPRRVDVHGRSRRSRGGDERRSRSGR